MMKASRPQLVYRSRSFAVIGWAMLAVLVFGALSLALAAPEPPIVTVPITLAVAGVLAWLAYRCYVAPRVVVDDREVRVVNPFRVRRLKWDDIERFEARPMLTIVRCDGAKVTAWAVPHAYAARLVGRTSQGENVVAALTRQLAIAKLPD